MIKRSLFLAGLLAAGLSVSAQSLERNVRQKLTIFFQQYTTTEVNIGTSKLEKFDLDPTHKKLTVYANDVFGYQLFTESNVKAIYRSLKQVLPGPVNYYDIQIIADGRPIETLIPPIEAENPSKERLYEGISTKQAPWVENISLTYKPTRGLRGHHLSLWQSHGRYYDNKKKTWIWQRPALFGTTEDLFTQSFVVPYLIPMLEHAGAVVYTPRERDWQRNEVIVDNDKSSAGSTYLEVNYKDYVWQSSATPGFGWLRNTYKDGENPFREGSTRVIPTMHLEEKAFAEWIPNIPEKGKYAVYVSYQTLPNSVPDATYMVFHNGGVTRFKVNQQMGGSTWVYLGTFEFDKGTNEYNMVVLSNESDHSGVVTADAVRFGGGMGNIEREGKTSQLPRYLEGARYFAQWAGMPYEIYSKSKGTVDYNDDINARSLTINYLSGGSVFNPLEQGLKVPFELNLAFHTDAGTTNDHSTVGTLGICETTYQDGVLGSGISRYASRDLAAMVAAGLKRDIEAKFPVQWNLRGIWDRNYSETRLPQTPSMILELLAHQNFADMKWGYNPKFQFTVARSVYKSILRFLSTMHDKPYVVQPLPVNHFAIRPGKRKHTFDLRWMPVDDPIEPSAKPNGYIVYTRVGHGSFDNGTFVDNPHFTFHAEPGLVYSFKVTAVNRGGESFASEILPAYIAPNSKGTILLINAFDKLSGPGIVRTDSTEGFDLLQNPGLPYQRTAAYCGPQLYFHTAMRGKEDESGLGVSAHSWEGRIIAGNTFDYPFIHGKAIQSAGDYSFVSCSDETVESGSTDLGKYVMLDLIMGAEDKGFSPALQKALTAYSAIGGNILVSGACIGSSMQDFPASASFAAKVLKYTSARNLRHYHADVIRGIDSQFRISSEPDSVFYTLPSTETIIPLGKSYPIYVYDESRHSAATVYKGDYKTFVLGFPIENIREAADRTRIMRTALALFFKK